MIFKALNCCSINEDRRWVGGADQSKGIVHSATNHRIFELARKANIALHDFSRRNANTRLKETLIQVQPLNIERRHRFEGFQGDVDGDIGIIKVSQHIIVYVLVDRSAGIKINRPTVAKNRFSIRTMTIGSSVSRENP